MLLFLSEALFDYKPPLLMEEHENDLRFSKNDVIEVLIETGTHIVVFWWPSWHLLHLLLDCLW